MFPNIDSAMGSASSALKFEDDFLGRMTAGDEHVVLDTPRSGRCSVRCYRSDRLIATEFVNFAADFMVTRVIIWVGKTVVMVDAADLGWLLKSVGQPIEQRLSHEEAVYAC